MPQGTYPHAWGRRDYNSEPVQYDREHPHICGEDRLLSSLILRFAGTSPHTWGRLTISAPCASSKGNIPTYVGKALKMLSKIKYLTFIKVPNLMAFISVVPNPVLFTCQRTSSPLSGNEPPYNTLSVSCVKQHHENRKRPNTQNQYSERR